MTRDAFDIQSRQLPIVKSKSLVRHAGAVLLRRCNTRTARRNLMLSGTRSSEGRTAVVKYGRTYDDRCIQIQVLLLH